MRLLAFFGVIHPSKPRRVEHPRIAGDEPEKRVLKYKSSFPRKKEKEVSECK
jgi:hypothetical protein